jgi:hypothetical protein
MLVDNLTRSVINSGFLFAYPYLFQQKFNILQNQIVSDSVFTYYPAYCANETLICMPPRVSTVGGEDEMYGFTLR